jgi:hypothetical protein
MIPASEVPEKRGIVISDGTSDSLVIIAGEPSHPALNAPRSGLFNECAFCEASRAEWHNDFNMLKHMAYECGFDYLLMRFDRTYRFRHATVAAAYFFSATPQVLRFDSSIVSYTTARGTRRLFFPCSACSTVQMVSAAALIDTSFEAKLLIIDKAEQFSRSFSSAMLSRNQSGGLRIAFSFGFTGMSFILDERTGISSLSLPSNLHGVDTGNVACKLAWYFNPTRIASGSADLGLGPSIKNVSISYTETQQVSVSFTATSDVGLRETRFSSDAYHESIYFKGSKREGVTKALQIDSSHYRLAITVYDLHGNAATSYYPIFEAKREAGREQEAYRKRLTEEHIWAQKSTLNGALYTLGQFDGNIGQWFKAIADASVAQDVRQDSLCDARMKRAVRHDTTHAERLDSLKTMDTGKTMEVIGE